ncbi:MAG: hypothetical protein LBG43_10500 [Treponema sp.]|jgi:hypothetical protein|nr:hypothetical protein [Treponema sp.]
MKKFFVVLLTLALVAGGVSAQTTVSGGVGYKWTVVEGSSEENSDLKTGYGVVSPQITLTASNEEKTFGGRLRLGAQQDWGAGHYAYAWWKPLDFLRLKFGVDGDGEWGRTDIVAWGFHAGAQDYVAGDPANKYYDGVFDKPFFGGFGGFGLWTSFTLIPNLAVNLAAPYPDSTLGPNATTAASASGIAKDIYNQIKLNITYAFSGAGTLSLAYESDSGKPDHTGKISASFLVTAISGIQINAGAKYTLPAEQTTGGVKTVSNYPVALGLGFTYSDGGDFGVKARLASEFAGSTKTGGTDPVETPFTLSFAVMPYYNLGIFTAYLNLGLDALTGAKKNGEDLHFGWYVNPYLVKTIGPGTIYAGFQLKGDPKKKTGSTTEYDGFTITWAVPAGISYSF